ncbi:hypothetical protein IWW55_006329 [Coemansia sp. RSA 2706]|nr:hypothetical protein LPJ63_000246 [Coemansia sp. RSA 2711]KAJ1848090.1 hypothetical protein LPJ70_001200 [Coemansia sp. RSA 2708]KAJ2289266.1 hypothetical protein IWW55_006329 [Coemansia sp. RSA 2706]KAJ2299615.1 hypothetical protein IWW54_006460 [Coemansia sp. RSA 2705]KAJ2305780.1 hypothetical protein IWW52_006352 [Coemansia sp. RSA 2704]KAJ2316117.1 hypothetical protein IWW51_005721 [Coemansia sp. RSA 2702]KAJ2357719.1 hypothetical protein H4S01_006437 [Coemansia sp. RSA 2610]KAJ236157
MILPSVRVFALGDVVLQGAPAEAPGFVFDGRVLVTVRVPTRIHTVDVVFQTAAASRWARLRARDPPHEHHVSFRDTVYSGDETWARGTYEFFFRIVLPGDLSETMFTEHKRVAYEVRASLGGSVRRAATRPVAVKRVPYFGSAWEALASDVVHVSAVWRDRIEMCALGCSRVQRDGRPLRVTGVVRALEKGFRLTKVGVILEERTRCRTGRACSSAVAASRFLRAGEHGDWYGCPIIDQRAFDLELQIPRAYGKIQYDVKHGSVTVSHRLAFVIAVVDQFGHGTSLRLFTPLHIMPHDWVDCGDELPAYADALADRVLLTADTDSRAVDGARTQITGGSSTRAAADTASRPEILS